jgi:hypothetical protein
MAKSGKIQDAAAAALSAIEEALDLSSEAGAQNADHPPQAGRPDFGKLASSGSPEAQNNPSMNLQLPPRARSEDKAAQQTAAPAPVAPATAPANDDRQSIGELRHALKFEPSGNILGVTYTLMAAWTAVWGLFVYFDRADILDPDGTLLAPKPLLAAFALIGPVLFLYITGLMARRAHEMRLIANSMTEVAIRLIEPETIATEQVVTLSQAIRREAASMGDGIERALARAGELEVIVRTEVSNLERSYSENERRIRLLIDELAREREAILHNADNARTALYGARDAMSKDISDTSLQLSEALSNASSRVALALGSKGEEIKLALEHAGDLFDQTLSAHGEDVVGRITSFSDEVTRRIGETTDDVTQRFADGVSEVDRRLQATGGNLLDDFGLRGQSVLDRLDELSARLSESIEGQSERLVGRVVDASDRVEHLFATHGETLGANAVSAADRIVASVTDHATSIRESFDAAGLQLSGMLDDAHNRAQEQFEAHGAALHERLSQSLADSAAELAEHSNAIEDRFVTAATEALSALGAHSDRVNETLVDRLKAFEQTIVLQGGELADRLASHGDRVGASIASGLAEFEESLTFRGEEIAARILQHSDNANAVLSEHLSSFERQIVKQSDDVVARTSEHAELIGGLLGERIASLEKSGEQIYGLLEGAQEGVRQEFELQADILRDNFARSVSDALSTLSDSSTDLHNRFSTTASEAVLAIATQGERINDVLAERLQAFENSVLTHGGAVARTLSERSDDIAREIGGQLHLFEQALLHEGGAIAERIGEHSHHLTAEVSAHLSAIEEAISLHGGDLNERIEAHTNAVADRIGEKAQRFADEVSSHLEALDHALSTTGGALIEKLGDRSEIITSALASQVERFESSSDIKTQEAVERLGDQAQRFAVEVGSHLDAIDRAISTTGVALVEQLGERAEGIAEAMSDKIEKFEAISVSKTEEAANRIEELVQRLDLGLAAGGKALQDRLAKHAVDVARTLGDGGREVLHQFEAKVRDIDDILLRRSTELTETLSSKAEEINATLGGRAEEIAGTLDGRIGLFEKNVVGRLDAVSSEIGDRSRLVVETISSRVEEINQTLAAARRELDTTLHGRTGELGKALADRVDEISSTLESRLAQIQDVLDLRGGDVTRELTSVGELVANAIESRGAAIVEHLGEKRSQIVNSIEDSTAALRDVLETGALSSIASIEETTHKLREALDSSSNNAVTSLVTTSEKLRAELPSVLDRLSQTNGSLRNVIESAGANLGKLESELTLRLEDFHGAIGSVSEEISRIGDLAGGTVRDAGSIVDALETHQTALAQSASQLAETQGALDQALDARKETLETLVDVIEQKRGDFDSAVASFANLVEGAFRQLDERAHEINSLLTQSTIETADTVEERFSELRELAARERERTAATLRANYEQAASELTKLLGQATEKFAGAAAEMRGLSLEVQREIEETRNEVRRGAAELPKETAEQAAALRRVVGDQVKALNELTDIVARSGRVYDISEHVAPPALPRRSEAQLGLSATARAESAWAPRNREDAPRAKTASPQPVIRLPEGRAPGSESTQQGSGWLSDLLARASRDDAPASNPQQRTGAAPAGSGALDSLTLEIARMVDHGAVVELWDRFQRGERAGLFGRRLYTGQGYQTFEEIRRRYRSDSAFRATIDHYVQEFERLLLETSRSDRDGSVARSYLSSDAGKVYTLLCHASSRFE